MATDTTHLPQGELNTDAGNDMAGSELEFGAVQLAQVTADGAQAVQLPQGQPVVLVPVQPGQALILPTEGANGLVAKIGPEGNLAFVIDGRTIIFQGYVQANDQSPVRVLTTDGDQIDVADVVAATDPNLDIQTAAGPAAGAQGDSAVGSGIYTPFAFGPALGGLNAIGVLDATALQYKLIDDERRTFTKEADDKPDIISISFDELGGIVNEDDLIAIAREPQDIQAAKLVGKNNNNGNDAFDPDNAENQPGDIDGNDGNPDPDREPLLTVATVTVNFGDDIPGKLSVGAGTLPGGLTSDGEAIVYQVLPPDGGQGNGIVAFVDGAGGTAGKFDEGIDRVIFDIKVQQDKSDSKFEVHFTLYDNIDNAAPDKNGDGESDLLGGNEQILKLPVQINVVDSEGDPASAVMQLGVIDDVPFFGAAEYFEGEGGINVIITPGDSEIVHDESKGPQGDADDIHWWQSGGAAGDATGKAIGAGFSLPYGDSQGAIWPKGVAQSHVLASFGADGPSQEQSKSATSTTARNSIFGELEDRGDVDGDGINDGENERPFELFMIKSGSGAGAAPKEDDLDTLANEGNLTIADQPTNATVSWTPWGGGETEILQVFLRQIDAQTIVGYVIPPEGQEYPELSREVELGNGLEAVFVITIDDSGKMTFVQYHQINHATDGPSGPAHDDTQMENGDFAIRGEDGTPVINVRISDNDGDHATQPVNLVIQDDGPKFCGVDWGCDNDSKYGKGIIDEDKLQPNGNNDWAPGDDKGGKHADGKINFDFGVDQPGSVEAHSLTVTDSDNQTLLSVTFSFVEDEFGNRTYTVSGDSDLKTADGHKIEIVATYDANTGQLTLTGWDTEDDTAAFVYHLQTTGYDKGEFDFCLNEALYHPYTDSDSQNDGPQKSFEDNLKFELNVRGYDVDGDWADGNICINVDDDSPKAECDYECVVEGTDGELNTVTGNVVTGVSAYFADDSNNLDGNADSPGADQPYTISKISHGGNTYELSDNHQTVSGLGPDDSFDATTGILTIKTAEGGTLEIVLVSNNQDEVGDYKYTVPADADHDTDKHAGPADEAASTTEAFDTVGEWEGSFAAAGITLIPSGGSLGLRDLSISGPAYRGIGVGSSEGDNNEVDNNGPNETLTLQIANPTNNIELTIGALYNGGPDGGAMENLRWEVWNGGFLVASGEILGTETGLVTLDIDTLLPFDKVVLKPSDNGQGESANNSDFVLVNAEICCPQDKFTEEFDYTLRDADGDEACATLKVEVKDTEPKVPVHDILTWVNVDEDGLPKGIGNSDSPLDAPGNSASFSGNISFTPGADPVTIELSVVGGPDTGLRTLDGEKVLATWDSVTGTLIGYIEGTDPAVAANQVFKMHITDAQTGAFTFDLLQEVKHADKDLSVINDTENLFDEFFLVKADIEDKDCDVASAIIKVVIDDDMPVIYPHATAIVDEDALPNGIEGGPGDDGVIAASFNGNLGVNFGADGGQSIVFSTSGQPNLKSGGATVQYTWVPAAGGLGTLIAHTGDVNNPVFKVQVTSLENGGEYTFTLLRPLDHPDSDNNPGNNNSDNGKGSYEDNLIFDLKFKATDGDNDTVDGKLKVNVDDDSPTICYGSGSITLNTDETLGGSGDAAGGGTRIENDEAGAIIPGVISGQVPAATVIGFSESSAAGLFSGNYGADGPGTTAYALTVLGTGATGLTDTATGTAITLVAGLNGVVLGKNAGGDVVFAFSIDASGNVTMVQYRAVNHGAEESAPGVHDEVTHFIQNALGVTATITDKDGDAVSLTRDISSSISIDDDGPQANNDYDSVKEGAGNYAAGNVVTGGDAALLGIDANLTDGTADNPGQDKPYTISKLTHDGQTYELSADGSSVSGLQPGESYNNVTGVLTITTAEGGTFEIVMKSATQSEVGEYKYTPGNPIHAEDVHVGPSVAQSNTDDFNSIGEWTTAFSTGGITLSAQGGNLTIKDVSIAGPNNDYRGVGITTGLDNGEVDTDNEKLTLTFDNAKFPGGVNNAEVQLGALFDGVQYDAGSQEVLRWEAYNGGVLVASGQIVGDFDGLVTLDIDTASNFNKIVLTPLNNGAGDNGNNSDFVVLNVEVCKQEPVCEEFGYTLRDGDGDESSATLKINVEDTYPTVPQQGSGTLSFLVDEDGLPGGIGNTDSPFDADENDAGADDAKFSGNIPFTPGADPVTVELFVGEPGTPGGGDTGLDTVDGKNVYAAWDAATKTLIGYIQGTDPSDAANRVFTMHMTNEQTGAFDFQLFKPVEHPNTDAGGANNNTENATDLSFTINVQIEDKDCDVAFTSVKVTIDDDMPTISANYCGSILLAVDETVGGGSDVAPNPGTTRENDEDQFNMPNSIDDVPGSPIGAAQANAAVLFNINPGADGLESNSTEYSLVITNGGLTGLIDTATGVEVRLYANGPDGIIVGRAGNSNAPIVLAFDINEDTGLISMAQFRAVNHGAEPADGPLGNHDEVIGFTKQALAVQVQVQDKDQDTVTSAPRDISSMITIDDDGPKITKFKFEHDVKLVVDETVGGSPNDNDETKSAGDANDIGFISIKASDLIETGYSFGSDGAAKSGSAVVSLVVVGGDGTASGLVDSKTDQNIVLITKPDGSVEGHVGSGAGDLAFIIKTTSGGDVTISQYRAVEHDNPNDNDESSSPEIMDSNKVLLQLTVTDGDGDKAQQTLDLGAIIKFEDDGPKANADVDSITEDSAEHAIGNVITPANVTPFGSDSNGTDGVADAPGSDGLKSITWTNVIDAADDYVQGTYGKLYVDAAGNYKYDLDESNPALATLNNGQKLQEVFNYTIKDGDDDKSSSTLTITIDGKTDAFPPEAANVTATVDEDGLPNGNTGDGYNSTGDDNANSGGDTDPNEAIYHNTLGIDWKGTPGDIALTAGDWTALRTIDNHTIIVDPASTENLLIGRDSVTGDKVFEVQIINETTGEYEVRLLKPLMHPDSNNNPADNATDFGQGSYEDNLTIPVNVKYTSIGGSIDRALSIDVDDDSPNWSSQSTNEVFQDDEATPLPGYTGIPGATVGSDVSSTATGGTISVNGQPGADGIESFTLDFNATAAANSGLRATDGTADGASIVYTQEGGDVVGRIGDGSLLNTEVFRFHSNGDGTYTFTRSSPLFHTGQGEVNNLTVTGVIKVTDRDGDAFTYPHNFIINDDMPSVTISTQFPTPTLVLDETRPVGTETDGDSDPAGKQTVTVDFAPNFNGAFGADGAADTGSKSYSLDLTGGPNVASGLYALTANGIGQGTEIVLNKVGNDIVGTANGDTYFTIKVDADGKVTFEQAKNVWHADAGNDDDTSSLHTATADALKLTLTLKDGDNDTASASIPLGHDKFQIEDDGPKAENDNVTTAPGVAGTADIVFIVDVSGSMTDGGGSIVVPNVPDFDDNRLGLARYSMQQLLLGHPEILNVQFVLFDDGVSSTVWKTRAEALTFIGSGPGDGNFSGGGTTNYDIALQEAMDEYATSPRPAGQAEQTLVYFLSDGAPNTPDSDPGITGNGGGSNVSVTEWETFVSNPANDITNVFALGLGGSANAGNLAPVSYPNTDTGAPGEDNVVLIPDANLAQLTQTLDDLLGTVLTPVTGDVTTNDSFGTDGGANPELVSVVYNAVTYTFGAPDNEYTINLGADRGTLKIKNDGTYTYTPPSAELADGDPFQVQYTIRDRDGDTSTANIIIDLTTPPTTDLNGVVIGDDHTVGFTEQTAVEIAPDATIAADVASLASMTVTLTNRPDGNGAEALGFTAILPPGVTANYNSSTGVLQFTGVASVAAYQGLLQSIIYNNTSDTPNTTPRDVTVVVNDGASNSVANHVTVNVTPVNDAPDANISAPSYTATEQTALNLHGTGLSISDVDAGNNDVTVTLSVGAGTLGIAAGNSGVSIGGNNSSSVTLTGTVAEINSLLNDSSTGTIAFTPSGGDNPPANTLLTLKVDDNGNTGGGNLSDTASVTININAVNDAPTTNNTSKTGNEDTTITISLSGGDVDGSVAEFKITKLPTNGTLYADAGLTNVITLNETVAAIANAASVFFVPTANFNGAASFEYAAVDNLGLADATPATGSITVNSVDDPTTANPDSIITAINNDNSFLVPHSALLANDSDADGGLTISQITAFDGGNTFDNVTTGGGNVTIDTDNDFDPGDVGQFTYKAGNATATVTVTAVSDGNITGTDNAEIIVDNDNAHTINAGKGNDIVFGNDGNDIINGGDGDDILDGGEGGDTYTGGKGNDRIDVGDGNDTVSYTSALDGNDVVSGFDANPGGGGQDTIDLNPLFDNLGVLAAARSARVDVQTVGSDTVVTVDVDGVAGFGANDVHITILNVTGLTKGVTGEDINFGN